MLARQLIVIEGEQEAGLAKAKEIIAAFPPASILDRKEPVKRVLGKEYQAIIYNTYLGLDPDELGALVGTIVAGGVLILVTPELQEWPEFNDPFNKRIANWPYQGDEISGFFIQRFVNKLKQAEFVQIISPQTHFPELQAPPHIKRDSHFKTDDQTKALNEILAILLHESPVPLVLEADRGRGKSAVLGMVAKKWQQAGQKKILVTAPTKKTAAVIFRHAGELEGLEFQPPDYICQHQPNADLLLVDEAASIPAALLGQMLKHYPRIIFSTTVHGYEGTGRGFAIRFQKQLDQLSTGWKKLLLKQPVRYAENDPLERFLFDALLLDACPVSDKKLKDFALSGCVCQTLQAEKIVKNEALLREVFGLLILAHYQTRPTDLRHLLDGKNVSIYVGYWQGRVIATALTVKEGGFNQELAHLIHYGKRRPQGHLVPQSLAVHAGIADAPALITERIMRIVVHPAVQRHGIASSLLAGIEEQSPAQYLSSSFGVTPGLLVFWQKQGYQVVRIGLNRDASSGTHSVIVTKALTTQGQVLCEKARTQFMRYFPHLLLEVLTDLEPGLRSLLADDQAMQTVANEDVINEQDQQDIDSFAFGHRGYETCMLAIRKLVKQAFDNKEHWECLTPRQQILLRLKVLEQNSWQQLIQKMSISGRKQALQELRQSIQQLVA